MARLLRWRRFLLCCAAIALCLIRLGAPALWEPDEGRYAEIPREMLLSGDYVTPHNDWVRYFEKPPLVYWITAGAMELLGRNEFAVRFQAAAASIGSVIVTDVLGEAMFGATLGLLAAWALLLSPLFFIFARFATPDPLLAFCIAGALGCFYFAARQPDFGAGRARLQMLAAAALLGFGTLTKGPVALFLGGAIALLWLVWEGRARAALRIRWVECIAVYLAIVLPWFILVSRRNPDFLHFFIWHEHVQRFLSATEHGWGPWFFVPIVIAGAWPWSFFAPFSLRLDAATTPEDQQSRSAIRFLIVWFALIFVFFSIPRAKLGEYILPAFPALAILAAVGLERATRFAGRRVIFAAFASINSIAAIALVMVLATVHTKLTGAVVRDGLMLGVVLAVGALAIWLGLRNFHARNVAPVTALFALMLVLCLIPARADLTRERSYRRLANAIQPYLAGGCALTSYHHFVQSLPFYTEHRELLAGYLGELAPFSGSSPNYATSYFPSDARLAEAWASPRCMVLISNRKDLIHLKSILSPGPRIIAAEGKKIALAKPAPSAESARLHAADQ